VVRIVQLDGRATGFEGIDSSFVVENELRLRFADGKLAYDVVSTLPYEKSYPRPKFDLHDATRFVAFHGERPVGTIELSKHWNGFTYLHHIVVLREFRRTGLASALLRQAMAWSQSQGFPGIMLETQNNNVAACKLYERTGFQLSGFDADLYRAQDPLTSEVALFWYWHSSARGAPAA
jgi:streptothricin acetyltransferase